MCVHTFIVIDLVFIYFTQIEFYLSDANLSRDKFLMEKVGKHGTECE